MKRTWISLLIILVSLFSAEAQAETILEGVIQVTATVPSKEAPEKIQPGSPMIIKLIVKNIGKEASPAGKVSVRYVFAPPLDSHPESLLFQSEQLDLPSLSEGKEIAFTFSKTHTWPSIFDFIRQDWGMRQYQAVVHTDADRIIGTTHIAFSCYYYQGPSIETPVDIP